MENILQSAAFPPLPRFEVGMGGLDPESKDITTKIVSVFAVLPAASEASKKNARPISSNLDPSRVADHCPAPRFVATVELKVSLIDLRAEKWNRTVFIPMLSEASTIIVTVLVNVVDGTLSKEIVGLSLSVLIASVTIQSWVVVPSSAVKV